MIFKIFDMNKLNHLLLKLTLPFFQMGFSDARNVLNVSNHDSRALLQKKKVFLTSDVRTSSGYVGRSFQP